jgi:hypothetical protein
MLRTGTFATAAALAAVATLTPSALAAPAPIHIAGTGADGVFVRPTPDTSQPAIGWMPEGAGPDYHCFTYGQLVGNVSVWFNVTYNGVTGFYASYFDDSHYQSEAELTDTYGVPKCGAEAPPSTPSPSPVPPAASASQPGVSYNRDAAVSWAVSHWHDKPPANSACTWYVSQALWAGGLPQSGTWTGSGSHRGRVRTYPGSLTAWSTPDFVNYVRRTFPRSTYTELDFKANRVPAAQKGDVILYSWDGSSSVADLDHAALVVNIVAGQYPEVSEWGTNDRGPFAGQSPYFKRGWTWSEKNHSWLQSPHEYPHVRAFLLHINTA